MIVTRVASQLPEFGIFRTSSQAGACRCSAICRTLERVEPRGFEPLTSAVQSQATITAGVRGCSERPAKQPSRLYEVSQVFAIVRVGWCTTGANVFQRNTPPTYP